ncbi:hypothetical protein ACOSMI_003119 [Pseudomonas aeruginosa]|uniref:hypothetical protein n=1 Tax=Pseudomonas aeruginosa TaxID=287 RepID=UPI0003B96E29|nr:hypothetical protein [Pseudomonas aeruginosa]EKU7366304.1 hypothetical protein [Pseudomonas aeruginosa]EKU7704588.1 hypothetical protein [Pseudomonas aeruginosa]ERY02124.1 hypothetical protein Q078_02976 [Pseudomonas aeruginosa BL24]
MTGRRLFILGNSFSKPIPLNPFPFLYIPQFSRFTLLVYLTLSQLGNHYGDGNRRYDDDDDYRDRRYYRRAGYRDGYYRHDNGHHYGQYKKWKRHKHHRRYYDD